MGAILAAAASAARDPIEPGRLELSHVRPPVNARLKIR
jgi:hypothetical protein